MYRSSPQASDYSEYIRRVNNSPLMVEFIIIRSFSEVSVVLSERMEVHHPDGYRDGGLSAGKLNAAMAR
jgi:hypothetical protein